MDYIFIAVDVAKDTLVVYNGKNTYTYPNERKLKHFTRFLRKRYRGEEKRLVIIYEPTGPYSAFLEEFCAWKRLKVVRLNPRKVPYLLEVTGQRAKTDHLDAKALYAYHKLLDPSEIQTLELDEKKEKMASLLSDYFFLRQQERDFANHLEALEWNPYSSKRSLGFVRKELERIREERGAVKRELEELSKEDQEIGRR